MELLVVVVIIGLALTIVLPNLDNLTPKHRLRAGAREVAATMELCRHLSISRVATYGIRYDLGPPATYRILLPPDEAEYREPLSARTLPRGITIDSIVLAGDDRIYQGAVDIDFSPTGEAGTHIVILRNEDDRVLSVKFLPLVGIASFVDDEAYFQEYHGG
jgi:type II secretory pathway pseudopilin PulG